MAAWSAFFADRPAPDGTGIRTRYVAMLGHVAGRFARDPAVAGYDLMNEPNAFSDEQAAALSAMYGRAIDGSARAEAAAGGFRHLVLFEPPAIWSSTGRGAPPDFPHDDDVVYAPHLVHGRSQPIPATLQVARSDEARGFGGAPVLFGEWGGDPDATTRPGRDLLRRPPAPPGRAAGERHPVDVARELRRPAQGARRAGRQRPRGVGRVRRRLRDERGDRAARRPDRRSHARLRARRARPAASPRTTTRRRARWSRPANAGDSRRPLVVFLPAPRTRRLGVVDVERPRAARTTERSRRRRAAPGPCPPAVSGRSGSGATPE